VTRAYRNDLHHRGAGSVDDPKSTDPAAAQTRQLVAEELADCGIGDDVTQS
jgi:hypothetical protein